MNTDDTYIDLQISNIEQVSSNKRAISSFFQSSSQVLIKDTTGYKLSIIRFVLNTESLPVFIPQLQLNEKNKTSYSFTFEYNGNNPNPISSIVFTTNFIPILSTNTPPIQEYKNGISNSSASFNFLNIITDFVGNDLNFTQNGFMQYDSQNNRYIALKDKQEIKSLDINVYWINKITGVMNPIYLAPSGFSSVKILLTKE